MSLLTPAQFRKLATEMAVKRHKYGVSKASDRTYANVIYHSKAECLFAQTLDTWKAAGAIKEWKRQVPFAIVVNAVSICTVVVDFSVRDKSGMTYYEVKGKELAVWRLKEKLLRACYPNINLVVVKQRRDGTFESKGEIVKERV